MISMSATEFNNRVIESSFNKILPKVLISVFATIKIFSSWLHQHSATLGQINKSGNIYCFFLKK